MNLSEEIRVTLLTQLHKTVESSANQTANQLNNGDINCITNYPPNGGLTESEKASLEVLKGNKSLRDAMRKILASNSASVLFELFSIIDGVSEPHSELGPWSGVLLIDKPKDFDAHYEFLHDEFYLTYWNWRKKRQADFKLDLLDD